MPEQDLLRWLLSAMVGVGLAAACGFRVFVPTLLLGVCARAGWVSLQADWLWIGSWYAIVAFAVASLLEFVAYYVPWLDNLLDTIATPAAVVSGVMLSASFLTGIHPMLQWSLALIAGGGAAGLVQVTTVAVRAASSTLTGGLANWVVASLEALGAVVVTAGAFLVPLLTVLVIVLLSALLLRKLHRRRLAAPA